MGREERMAPSPADLVAYRALSEEEARRKFKSKQSKNSGGGAAAGPASTSVKKRKSKKLTLKKILDASQLDKLPWKSKLEYNRGRPFALTEEEVQRYLRV